VVRGQLSRVGSPASDAAAENRNPEEAESAEEPEPFASTFQERLQRVLGRESESPPLTRPQPEEETRSRMESDRSTTSPQAWIEGLRRHK
jgi:hypothetical protein